MSFFKKFETEVVKLVTRGRLVGVEDFKKLEADLVKVEAEAKKAQESSAAKLLELANVVDALSGKLLQLRLGGKEVPVDKKPLNEKK